MTAKRTVALVLAAAVALVASVAWAVTRSDDRGSMMAGFESGMMGDAWNGSGQPVGTLAGAKRQAQGLADRLDLKVGEVMRFTNHYYAELLERDGDKATEVLVSPVTGAVRIEPGPAMMWNTRYGMMSDFPLGSRGGMMDGGMMDGGMMGGGFDLGGEPTISAEEAEQIADDWLERNRTRLRASEADDFPGYYTLHSLRGGRIAGMLSVNAFTGAVWPHWWHGRFVSMIE